MAANLNGYNVGTDVSMTISDQYGDVFPADILGHITDLTLASVTTKLTVIPITNGGIPIHQTIWAGVTGSMAIVRVNRNFTAMMLELANAYHTQGFITQFSAQANVLNRDGSVDEYLISGLQFSDPSHGNFRNTKEVDMSVKMEASLMTLVGGASSFLTGLPTAA